MSRIGLVWCFVGVGKELMKGSFKSKVMPREKKSELGGLKLFTVKKSNWQFLTFGKYTKKCKYTGGAIKYS